MMVRVDSGRSWLVCFVSFSVGVSGHSVGVYYVEFLSVFNESKGMTAMVSALNMGSLCCTGRIKHS